MKGLESRVEARIIGLKGSGKSTLMRAIGHGRADGDVATVKMGDPRVRRLAEIFKPRKTTLAEFRVWEAPWPAASHRKSEMDRYLDGLTGSEVFLHVLRGFDNPLLSDAPDPKRDLSALDDEFLVADLVKVERALDKAKRQPIPAPSREALDKCRRSLEASVPLRRLASQAETGGPEILDPSELEFLRGYGFLTLVTQVLLLNSSEDPGATIDFSDSGRPIIAFPFSEAAEVARLSPAEQQEFAEALGLPGPAAELVARAAFAEMGLISFLTTGEDEVRAWPIRRGETARRAGRTIHSDIERGFIRAEVVRYEDFVSHPSQKECREAGLLRIEGKDYIVSDGDIINFRFNV